ncbi:ABC transporter permease [Sulfobacillus thermosulfidooxidans]|uniref:ABC transporter permease n=1 Tax=Sulfobacillus thermosulfidooxidans TaxID=28034 RepID=UPI0002FD5972|nr:ABC transporter permease [Sulfobacillus thermosulfidooxidans]
MTDQTPPSMLTPQITSSSHRRSSRYEYALLGMIVVVIIATSIGSGGNFWSETNLDTILVDVALTAIPAIGMTFVIITGGIDVSVGAILGLSAAVTGIAYNQGLSPWSAAIIGILAGTIMGLINGIFIAYIQIPPIITTLGFLSIWSAALYLVLGGNWITNIPSSYTALAVTAKFVGIPLSMWVALVLVAAFSWILAYRSWGRYLYAMGNNAEAARIFGLPLTKTTLLAYTLLGMFSAVAGIVHLGLSPLVQASTGSGFELTVIAAVVVGGTNIVGGRGTIVGSLLGAIFVEIINDAVVLFHIQAFWQGVALGCMILISVMVGDFYRQRQKAR